MKKLFVTLLTLATLGSFEMAQASGCAAGEWQLKNSRSLESSAFADAVKNFSVNLTADRTGKITSLELFAYTEKIPTPRYSYFFWHKVRAFQVTQDMTFANIISALATAKLEVTEDTYEDGCGIEPTTTQKNIRIFMAFNNEKIEFNTNYYP